MVSKGAAGEMHRLCRTFMLHLLRESNSPRRELSDEVVAHVQDFKFLCFTQPVWQGLHMVPAGGEWVNVVIDFWLFFLLYSDVHDSDYNVLVSGIGYKLHLLQKHTRQHLLVENSYFFFVQYIHIYFCVIHTNQHMRFPISADSSRRCVVNLTEKGKNKLIPIRIVRRVTF